MYSKIRRIGLSGYRPLILNAKDGSVTKNTPLDQFLSDTRRQENPQISLLDWGKICNCRKNCGADHVPVFTGIPTCPIWPVSEEYAKGQLMIFSQGTWKTTDDLLATHDTFTSAFAAFLDSENCPSALQKNNTNKRAQDDYNSGSQFTDSQNSTMEDLHLGAALLRDVARQNTAIINDQHIQAPLPDGGPSFDWQPMPYRRLDPIGPMMPKHGFTILLKLLKKLKLKTQDIVIYHQQTFY